MRTLRLGAALVIAAGALAGASGSLDASASRPEGSAEAGVPSSTATPSPNEKQRAAERTTPGPSVTPRRLPGRTASEFAASLATDPDYQNSVLGLTSGVERDPRVGTSPITLGEPQLVVGIGDGAWNEYVVPLNAAGVTVTIAFGRINADGTATLVAMRGWSMTPAWPAATREDALDRGGVPGDPAVSAELAWATPRTGGDLAPFWRIRRASGRVVYLLETGQIVEEVLPLR